MARKAPNLPMFDAVETPTAPPDQPRRRDLRPRMLITGFIIGSRVVGGFYLYVTS
jgi:hypothetical protein